MRRLIIVIILVVSLSCFTIAAIASIRADEVFDSITTTLTTSKTASFSAVTFDDCNSIGITRVRLYKLVSNAWVYQGDLPIPTNPIVQPDSYYASIDYSSYIGTGTYRIYTTFSADGHTASRYSNTRTY